MTTKPRSRREVPVLGIDLDANTRCAHYHGPTDVIAIKMRCCQTYYACIDCHGAMADHPAEIWLRGDWKRKAILCGICRLEMPVVEYMNSENRCPGCAASFNPGCRNHYPLYFEGPYPFGLASR